MKRSLIKAAAVATILAFGGLGVAHNSLAWGRFDGCHFGQGGRVTGKLHDHDRQVSPDRPPKDEEISARNRLSVHRAGLLRWRRLTPIGKERKRRLHAPKPHETLNFVTMR